MSKYNNTISVFEFLKKFPSEYSARRFFEKRLWGDNPICPYCKNDKKHRIYKYGANREGFYSCKDCRKQFTIRVGSVLESSRIPLLKWIYTMYLMVTARKSISSLQISKEIGVTQKTAWFLMHRIRKAFDTDAGFLSGIVEMDETYIGGLESNKHKDKRVKGTQGRSTKTKAVVVGMRTRDGKIKAGKMEVLNIKTIQNKLEANVEKGSILCTDDARHYKRVRGYHHLLVNHSVGEFVNGMASTNGIESMWAVLKRGYTGTFHHFSRKHTDNRYVDEFAFRLNECSCKLPTMERINNILKSVKGKRLTYKQLIA